MRLSLYIDCLHIKCVHIHTGAVDWLKVYTRSSPLLDYSRKFPRWDCSFVLTHSIVSQHTHNGWLPQIKVLPQSIFVHLDRPQTPTQTWRCDYTMPTKHCVIPCTHAHTRAYSNSRFDFSGEFKYKVLIVCVCVFCCLNCRLWWIYYFIHTWIHTIIIKMYIATSLHRCSFPPFPQMYSSESLSCLRGGQKWASWSEQSIA